MRQKDCSVCGHPLTEYGDCAPCAAAHAIVKANGANSHYEEALAEQIGNILRERNWIAEPIKLSAFPRFRYYEGELA